MSFHQFCIDEFGALNFLHWTQGCLFLVFCNILKFYYLGCQFCTKNNYLISFSSSQRNYYNSYKLSLIFNNWWDGIIKPLCRRALIATKMHSKDNHMRDISQGRSMSRLNKRSISATSQSIKAQIATLIKTTLMW